MIYFSGLLKMHVNQRLAILLNYAPYISFNKKGIIIATLDCVVTILFLFKNYCACTSNDISILPLVAFE